MGQIRVLIAVAGLVVALAPVGAAAQAMTNEQIIAANQAVMAAANNAANLANDLARCKLASAGGLVSGSVGFSQPNPGGCSAAPAMVPAPTPSSNGKCVASMRALTKAELDQVNEFVINAADAIADNETHLATPPEITALIC